MLQSLRREARRGSAPTSIALILALTSTLIVQQGRAQIIDGMVVDSASRAPVAGTLVSLVDNEGRDLQRFLVDAGGTFRFLLAGQPGTYSLRAERLGMATKSVGALDVGAADTVTVQIVLPQRPIALTGIETSGERRCELPAALGEATHRVWEEARKVLQAVSAADAAGRYVYDLERHVRELEPGSLKIRSETRKRSQSMDERPIRSHPVERLVSEGWVIGDEAGYRFFAPDAHTLLSEPFLATHCLRLRGRDESRPDLVGLEFRPIRRQPSHTDIEGILWLSRETGQLEWLDFDYRSLPGLAAEHRSDQIGGRVEFLGVPDGGWIVSKWHIRMPRMIEERDPLFGGRRARLGGITEEGGRVVRTLRRNTGRVTYAEQGGALVGVVAGGAAGDRVAVVGVGIEVALDEAGGFAITGLPEGRYQLAHVRPGLQGLDLEYVAADAQVLVGDTAVVRIEAPSRHQVLAAACQVEEWDPATGVLLGDVSRAGAPSQMLEGVEVVAEWVVVRDIAVRLSAETRREKAMTDRLGRFRICGVPAGGHTIVVTARSGAARATGEVVLSPEQPVGRVSLALDSLHLGRR